MKLLGRIEKRSNYFNFFPKYEYADGVLREMPEQELESKYPLIGGVNLAHEFGEEYQFLIDNVSTDEENEYVKNIYMIEMDDGDLEDNVHEVYKKKVPLRNFLRDKKRLADIIRPASDFHIYKIVSCEKDVISQAMFLSGYIFLKGDNITEKERVVLPYDGKYYGPFEASRRAIDGKYYVKPNASENQYLIDYYNWDEAEELHFEKSQSYRTTSSKFLFATGDLRQEDVVTDEVLLGKALENISVEIASSNPEEFCRLFKQSPFLANTPKDIVDKRWERLNDIISDSGYYNEQKLNMLKELLAQYRDGLSSEELAIDPYVSSKMLKAASDWDTEAENREYEERARRGMEREPSALYGEALVNYVIEYVQGRRDYSRNDIMNIYVSIAQNFLTIFSGEPGIGKTSMCNIIAESLGLLDFGGRLNRYVTVSVERGWSSKRDLIGYFNPLTKKYDRSNVKIYDALRVLDLEREGSKYPYLIMLDEANLSPIEYYWADFMRLTDRSSISDEYINIGMDRELFVPETLRFVATINTDQTTETLSPRLIDRACVIKLPEAMPRPSQGYAIPSREAISWENFVETFSKDTPLSAKTRAIIENIYDLFKGNGMNVSARTRNAIDRYVKAAQSIMEDEYDVSASEKAVDFAVVQKLLPKINGYYANYERFFDSMKRLCAECHLKMAGAAVDKMVDDQERNMGYCQYLI